MSEPVLSVRNLTAGYGARPVLRGVDLSICRGEWFSLLGPNGSGKTTLLRCVSGQIVPAGGTVRVGGLSVLDSPVQAKRLLGYAHPPRSLPGLLTGRQCLEVYAAAHDLAGIGRGILDLAAELRLAQVLDQWVETWSLGMRQKLAILLALIGNPALVVLDEAFNGLDPASALIVRRELHRRTGDRRCAVLFATHALDSVLREATRAALLLEGGIGRTWDGRQLAALRADGPGALEAALADAASAQSA
jgi:ABC-2 type transport system ATP-binding protein